MCFVLFWGFFFVVLLVCVCVCNVSGSCCCAFVCPKRVVCLCCLFVLFVRFRTDCVVAVCVIGLVVCAAFCLSVFCFCVNGSRLLVYV